MSYPDKTMNIGISKNMQYGLLRHADACASVHVYPSSDEWSPVSFASLVMLRTDLVTIQGDPGSSG